MKGNGFHGETAKIYDRCDIDPPEKLSPGGLYMQVTY